MDKKLKERLWIVPIILAFIIGSVSVVGAIEKNHTAKATADSSAVRQADAEKPFLSFVDAQISRNSYTRSRWLCDLMEASGKPAVDRLDPEGVFSAAQSCGILPHYTAEDITKPLDRLFVAQTAVRALGYKHRDAGRITDITMQQSDLSTMVYYGYFLPDANDMIYPSAEITAEEYARLQTELDRCQLLRGKNILTFGDSIMHGSGNNNCGIGTILAEKYGMTAEDYSVPGAAMGYRAGRGHIRDQVLTAAQDNTLSPDVILLNGGTNDMNHTRYGELTDSFDVEYIPEDDFTGGFEKTMWSLQQNWANVPVIYIRVHNMDLGSDENERLYGLRGLAIAKKWGADTVDLYTDTDMNTEDPDDCTRYTYRQESGSYNYDAIHPNALGYAKYYLPLISAAIEEQFTEE